MEDSDILLHFVSGMASGITRRVIDEILKRFDTKGLGTKMSTHSGGIFENYIRYSPPHIESKNNIVPKPIQKKHQINTAGKNENEL